MSNELEGKEFIDWAIKERENHKGMHKEIEMLNVQIALMKKAGKISAEEELRYYKTKSRS